MIAGVQAFGDGAWRANLPEGVDRRLALQRLRRLEGVVDAVVTEQHVLVTFDPSGAAVDPVRLASLLASLPPSATESAGDGSLPAREDAPREHLLRVRYDGPDLPEIAARTGLSVEEVVRRHAAPTYAVSVVGFLPGFAYLRGLDPSISLPRRAWPRPRVDACSVGVAGAYSGVYPFASPGGWNLLGTVVGATLVDPTAGALLSVGDRVRFIPEPR